MARSSVRIASAVLLLAAFARGDDVEMARQRYTEGVEAFDKGDFERARAAFLQAWALRKHVSILIKLAQSSLKSHKHDAEAARYFRELLARSDVAQGDRNDAERGLAETRTRDGRIDVRATSGVALVDGEVVPADRIVDVEPGGHDVSIASTSTTKHVTVAAGEVLVVELSLPPDEDDSAPDASAPDGRVEDASVDVARLRQPTIRLGDEGESCESKSDCQTSLRCMRHVCVDATIGVKCTDNADCGGSLTCVSGTCGTNLDDVTPPGDFNHGFHPFAGFSGRGGPAWGVVTSNFGGSNDPNAQPSFAFSLRGGAFYDNHEIALEIAPFTSAPYSNTIFFLGTAFEAVATYGYYVPLASIADFSLFYPVRIGAGIMAGGDNTASLAFFVARLDLIGLAVRVSRLVLGVDLPSFTYMVTSKSTFGESAQLHLLSWHAGFTASFLF
jgi:hypothetical protein